jgi:hypothetical protein
MQVSFVFSSYCIHPIPYWVRSDVNHDGTFLFLAGVMKCCYYPHLQRVGTVTDDFIALWRRSVDLLHWRDNSWIGKTQQRYLDLGDDPLSTLAVLPFSLGHRWHFFDQIVYGTVLVKISTWERIQNLFVWNDQ